MCKVFTLTVTPSGKSGYLVTVPLADEQKLKELGLPEPSYLVTLFKVGDSLVRRHDN